MAAVPTVEVVPLRSGFLWTQQQGSLPLWAQRWFTLTSEGCLACADRPQDAAMHLLGRVVEASLIQGQVMLPTASSSSSAAQYMPAHMLRVRLLQPLCNLPSHSQPHAAVDSVVYAGDLNSAERWVRSMNDSAYACSTATTTSQTLSQPSSPPRLKLSDRLHIDQCSILGSGLTATVFLATEVLTGEQRAIKVFKPSTPMDHNMVLREHQVWSALGPHPNVCQLLDTYSSSASLFLVSELCHGGSLQRHLAARSAYSEHDAARLMRQVLEALHHIHSCGAVHCDVKPENICMVSRAPDSPLKLVDMGMASFIRSPMEPGGTPEFVAPELLQRPDHYAEKGCGPEVDVWSAGILLYYLLCGKTPFHHPDTDVVLARARAGAWTPCGTSWLQVSDLAKHLVHQMLQVAPQSRPSVSTLLQHPWFKIAALGQTYRRPLLATMMAFKGSQREHATPAAALPPQVASSAAGLPHALSFLPTTPSPLVPAKRLDSAASGSMSPCALNGSQESLPLSSTSCALLGASSEQNMTGLSLGSSQGLNVVPTTCTSNLECAAGSASLDPTLGRSGSGVALALIQDSGEQSEDEGEAQLSNASSVITQHQDSPASQVWSGSAAADQAPEAARASDERLQQIHSLQQQVAELRARLQAKGDTTKVAGNREPEFPSQVLSQLPLPTLPHEHRTLEASRALQRTQAESAPCLTVLQRSVSAFVPGTSMARRHTRLLQLHHLQQQLLSLQTGLHRTGSDHHQQHGRAFSRPASFQGSLGAVATATTSSVFPTSPPAQPLLDTAAAFVRGSSSSQQLAELGFDAGMAQVMRKLEVEAARLKQLKRLQDMVTELQLRLERA